MNEQGFSFAPDWLWDETKPREGDEPVAAAQRERAARSLRRLPFYLGGSVTSFVLAELPDDIFFLDGPSFWSGVACSVATLVSYHRGVSNAVAAHKAEPGSCNNILPYPPNWPDPIPLSQG